jgi:hypothetical protein
MGMCHQKDKELEPLRDLSFPSEVSLFGEVIQWPQGMSSGS